MTELLFALMKIKSILANNRWALAVWAFFAAFGAYFSTYAFRKPYTTGSFEGLLLVGDLDLKTTLIISQILGYMLSKFLGVKIISELKQNSRVFLILMLVGIAQFALFLFAYFPAPYNIIFMFLNGLPLGMVWGVIFSYLEGRRFTEFLGIGLSINMIMTSGILKSLYKYVQSVTGFGEFTMPAVIGCIFIPFFLFFVWMLAQIPQPNMEDRAAKQERYPMDNEMKRTTLLNYGLGLLSVIVAYCLFTTLRDFRDNFMVEILSSLSYGEDIFVYARLETTIALIVMVCIAAFIFFRNNLLAYKTISAAMVGSSILMLTSTIAFENNQLSPFQWMACLGVGFFLPYLMIQIAYFERIISIFKIKGNAGYFVYLCDSIGYLGSVMLLLYKEFLLNDISFADVLIRFSKIVAIVAMVSLTFQYLFFSVKLRKNSTVKSELIEAPN